MTVAFYSHLPAVFCRFLRRIVLRKENPVSVFRRTQVDMVLWHVVELFYSITNRLRVAHSVTISCFKNIFFHNNKIVNK